MIRAVCQGCVTSHKILKIEGGVRRKEHCFIIQAAGDRKTGHLN